MADNPNVGPEPVKAKPNAVREKTYEPPNPPAETQAEKAQLPEATTRRKVADELEDKHKKEEN